MRNEYRIRRLKDHPGYVFVQVRYWWLPLCWDTISAHGDWMPAEQQMQEAKDSALAHAKGKPKAEKSKTVEYLGRLP